MKLFVVFLSVLLACNTTPIFATTAIPETTSTLSQSQVTNLTGAYILGGFLYIKADNLPDTIELHQLLDATGKETNVTLNDIHKIKNANHVGYAEYALYHKGDKVYLDDGKYELVIDGTTYPVLSIANYRQDSELRTINDNQNFNGKEIPFCDYVYPVIFNQDAYDNLSFEIIGTTTSLNPDKWPQILRDGVKENTIQISYPKDANTNEPKTYTDFPETNEKAYSLDHQDKLIVKIDNTIVDFYLWDQISKIWYQEMTDPEQMNMIYVKGGQYLCGDWKSTRESKTPLELRTHNMKKSWLNVKDPMYMNETAIGQDAVGVSGLKNEDSLAKTPNSDMWNMNDDAKDQHQVSVSDFMIGKYEVTMDQYYAFINATEGEAPHCTYTIDDKTYTINEIASYTLYDKRQTTRDNGWGEGSRPAIDVTWYEAVEFCNYLSRVEGLEPCYTFTNIYNGEVGDGLTSVNFLNNVSGSVMQKQETVKRDIQLVKVDCDFNKNGYRLPTESEFEYAARGGKYISQLNDAHGYEISGVTNNENINDYVWYRDTVDNPSLSGSADGELFVDNKGAVGYTNPVGSKLPNILGIHDLTGNVWEQTWDYYNASYYGTLKNASGVHQNPTGPQYTIAEISILDDYPVDPYMANEYQYTYVPQGNGLFTRTAAQPLLYSGKFIHTLRGGCFGNYPDAFAITVSRFAPSLTDNIVNFSDARIGFRVARSVTES